MTHPNGESSRSVFQQGKEHWKEIEEGVVAHPLVIQFMEEHGGRRQETMLRVLSGHLTSLSRQTTESANILESGKKLGEALN